ncbi:hypothetical protein GCM10010387_15480 [Streptomyces inusitatus]|uniref:Uncharacterized protein n=1 Tax=Streptomyces inusitatus TaxID=68221 RepID=A0A918UMX3_9ACTN|nr:hypothetical protein GCM10010387_15480 [Streptomyces inusitatus]
MCAALASAAETVEGQPGCPCRACVVPGTVAWDSCEDPCAGDGAGQLSVSVIRAYAATLDGFPAEARTVFGVRGCVPPPFTAVEIAVTLLRCTPGFDERGCPPSCDDLALAARRLHVDMVTVTNALLCCLPGTAPSLRRGRRFSLGASRTVGPDGGCVGLEQRATVALGGCICRPDEGTS